jgi:uncharacterized protein (DUF1499 family)
MLKTEIAFLFSVMILAVCITACSGVRPVNLGVHDGKLAPCPPSPNCVSSQSTDREHFIAPLSYATSTPEALSALKKVVLGMKRAKIVEERDSYLHAEFTSLFWRFVDDVEFYLDDHTKTIQFRSASRLGKFDFGVNRKRMDELKAAWSRHENND